MPQSQSTYSIEEILLSETSEDFKTKAPEKNIVALDGPHHAVKLQTIMFHISGKKPIKNTYTGGLRNHQKKL